MFHSDRRLKRLEELVEAQERKMKAMELEWADTYDKLTTTVRRWAKRIERAQIEEDQRETDTEGIVESPGGPVSMTQRQRELNAQILARRSRGPNGVLPR